MVSLPRAILFFLELVFFVFFAVHFLAVDKLLYVWFSVMDCRDKLVCEMTYYVRRVEH